MLIGKAELSLGPPGWAACHKRSHSSEHQPGSPSFERRRKVCALCGMPWFWTTSSHADTHSCTCTHSHAHTCLHKERMRERLKKRWQHQWLLPNLYLIFCWSDMLVSIATLGGLDNMWSEFQRGLPSQAAHFQWKSFLSPRNCSHWAPGSVNTCELGNKDALQPERKKCPAPFSFETPELAIGERLYKILAVCA